MAKNSRTYRSFAKINTHLEVGRLRPDQFHEIKTNFLSISLHDLITIKKLAGGGISFSCNSDLVPHDESNLVVKAARAFLEKAGVTSGFEITLDKRITVSAGLGGGSSNDAVTLLGLNELSQNILGNQELAEIAISLGSDVPYFLKGGYARGKGRGENLLPLPEPEEMTLLLIIPDFGISAPDAYREFDLTFEAKIGDISSLSHDASVESNIERNWFNDLERGIFARHPELAEIRDVLIGFDADESVMSGSGSVVIGKFSDKSQAEKVANTVRSGNWAWNVILATSVTRDQYNKRLRVALE